MANQGHQAKAWGYMVIFAFLLAWAAPAAGSDFTIKLGHCNDPDPKNSIFHAMALNFQENVTRHSQGRVAVDIFPAFQLGEEQEQVRACQLGTQEATLVSMNNLNVFAVALGYFTLPYMFETVEEGRQVIDGMWDQMNQWATGQAGVRLLCVSDAGFRVMSNSKRPVTKLADLKGLKIRVPQNPIMIGAFKSWGIEPVPMAWSEVFNALQQKVIDGQENPYNVLLAVKFYEVQKYVTDIDFVLQTGALALGEAFFQKLPPELREAVVRAGKDTMAWERKYIEEVTASDLKRLKELGMVFAGQPTDKAEWVKRARGIWPDQYKLIGGGDPAKGKAIVDQVVAATEKVRQR